MRKYHAIRLKDGRIEFRSSSSLPMISVDAGHTDDDVESLDITEAEFKTKKLKKRLDTEK